MNENEIKKIEDEIVAKISTMHKNRPVLYKIFEYGKDYFEYLRFILVISLTFGIPCIIFYSMPKFIMDFIFSRTALGLLFFAIVWMVITPAIISLIVYIGKYLFNIIHKYFNSYNIF